jgi:hypothetical protein
MSSRLRLKAGIAQRGRHFAFVPNSRHALALMFAVILKPYTASALVREAEH